MVNALNMENVFFAYDQNLVLEDVNLVVEEKDFLAIVGPNGGGKTTILRLILGYLQPVSGRITVFGKNNPRLSNIIGYVPQNNEFLRNFPVTVLDVVLMGRLKPGHFFWRYTKEDYEAAHNVMEAVKVTDLAGRRFGTLSGGEKQRTLIARALSSSPRLLILDEPTASVDSRVEQDIYDLLKVLNKEITIIIVSHDLGFVSSYVNKVACVNKKLVVHNIKDISQNIIEETYDNSIHMLKHECNL